MLCPHCNKQSTFVKNSRTTHKKTQIWRRRYCSACKNTFTTYESIDLGYLVVVKKSGKTERFSRMKLYSGVYNATLSSKPNKQSFVDSVTRTIEQKILALQKRKVHTEEIADITLKHLLTADSVAFLRFLAYCKEVSSPREIKQEVNRYLKTP